MSYRLNLLRLKWCNFKATVTNQKCTNIWKFDFDLLRVELGPYGHFWQNKLKEQLSSAQLIGLYLEWNNFLYATQRHSEKSIDIHCKVTFGFKYRREKEKIWHFPKKVKVQSWIII